MVSSYSMRLGFHILLLPHDPLSGIVTARLLTTLEDIEMGKRTYIGLELLVLGLLLGLVLLNLLSSLTPGVLELLNSVYLISHV